MVAAELDRRIATRAGAARRRSGSSACNARGLLASRWGEQGKQALEKALADIGKQQAQLNQQAAPLDAHNAQTDLQKARQAMNEAQAALQKNNAAEGAR